MDGYGVGKMYKELYMRESTIEGVDGMRTTKES
jgi:hypothetical protein